MRVECQTFPYLTPSGFRYGAALQPIGVLIKYK